MFDNLYMRSERSVAITTIIGLNFCIVVGRQVVGESQQGREHSLAQVAPKEHERGDKITTFSGCLIRESRQGFKARILTTRQSRT